MALGAQSRDILVLVLKRGMGLAMLGLAIGLAAAFTLTRLMQSLCSMLAQAIRRSSA